jgi:glutamate dehydrogenase
VRRHDGDDPYLVVAADKGTATFSDIANGISADYGFWLGDAFASGGSAGYDHKKMGITARGAWEAVKRHFREMGRDIQKTPFTVIGVGDMSGDVFGNGMLLSQHQAVAAFDHRTSSSIPNPDDPAQRWAERKRMFALPRSSWAGLRRRSSLKGGGVFDRAAKSVPLSPEAARRSDWTRPPLAHRADQRHPEGAGRPALVRRHRHLCEGVERKQRRCRRPRQRCDPRRRRSCVRAR